MVILILVWVFNLVKFVGEGVKMIRGNDFFVGSVCRVFVSCNLFIFFICRLIIVRLKYFF